MRGPFPEMRIIFAEEFRRQIRNWGFIFVTAVILVPTALIVGMIVAGVGDFSGSVSFSEEGLDDDEVSELLERTGYVDQAGALSGPGLQDAPKRYNDSVQGIQAVRQGEIDTLFVLTADYLESGCGRAIWDIPRGWWTVLGQPGRRIGFQRLSESRADCGAGGS